MTTSMSFCEYDKVLETCLTKEKKNIATKLAAAFDWQAISSELTRDLGFQG